MAERRLVREYDLDNMTVTFRDLKTGKSTVVEYNKFPDDMQKRFALGGVNAACGDSAASPDVDSISVIEQRAANIMAGNWTVKGAGGGGRTNTLLARALAQHTGSDIEAVVAKLKESTDERKKELARHPQIKAIIEQIKLDDQRAKTKEAKDAAKGEAPELVF